MRVGIYLADLLPKQMGGIETYARDLVRELPRYGPGHEYIVFTTKQNHATFTGLASNTRIARLRLGSGSRVARKLLSLRQSALLRRQVDRQRLDVLHFPLQVIPTWLQNSPTPKVLSIMDLQHEYFREFFSGADLAARRIAFPASVASADAVIAISDFTKQSIVEQFGTSPNKVHTVHLSYEEALFDKGRSLVAPQAVAKLRGQYFYYPAATWPHKNHARLIQAFAVVAEKYPEKHLVLSGIAKAKSGELESLVAKLGLGNRVHILGYVTKDELSGLFREAFALVFPSLFEGFGIPLIEAMAVECPVAASDSTSVPEVGGDAVLYFDPEDTQSIAQAMTRLIIEPELRRQLVSAGTERIRLFSQRAMAEKTLAVYRNVYEQN